MKECSDCEREYEDELVSSRTNRCKMCSNRYKNAKYGGIEYIPIKDLPIEEQKKKVEHHFKIKAKHANTKKTQVKVDKANEVKDSFDQCFKDIEILELVKNDIDDAFESVGIPQDYLEFKRLPELIEMLFELVVSEKKINDAKEAEKVFNNLGTDYDHLIEESERSGNKQNIVKFSLMRSKLKDLRRPTKDVITYLDILEPVLLKIKQYPILVKEIENSNEELHKKLEYVYYIKASQFAKKEVDENPEKYKAITSNVLSPLHSNKKHFNWQVSCFNLYGNPNRQQFVSDKGVWANNIVDAKFRVKKFLSEYFPNVTYMEKDIIVEEDFNND